MPESTSLQFPINFRFITEMPRGKQLFYGKIFCFSFVTTFLLVSITLRGFQLFQGIQLLHAATNKREALLNERSYWQGVVSRHPGYRDAEFKLAVLSYQLGEKDMARNYLNDTLTIDPNFIQARQFAKQVGL